MHSLSTDLSKLIERHEKDMEQLQAFVMTPQGQAYLQSIPELMSWPEEKETNCLAYALHRAEKGRLQPGQLSGTYNESAMGSLSGFFEAADDVSLSIDRYECALKEGLQNDGIKEHGDDLAACAGNGMPLLLVLGDYGDNGYGYHVLVLRRTFNETTCKNDKLVWAEKFGEEVRTYDGGKALFNQMNREGFFDAVCGYYSVPEKLLGSGPSSRQHRATPKEFEWGYKKTAPESAVFYIRDEPVS